MKVRALRSAVLAVALAFPVTSRADDLDALLAQPPSASLSSEDAAHRIEMLRGLISDHPDRTDEIEAYLIPFVRATQPPPAESTPPPTPAPPPAKPMSLLLLREPNGMATTMKATSYRRQGPVIIVVGANGSRAVLQATTVAGELPWYSDEALKSGVVDLKDLAGRYEIFAKAIPGLRPALTAESTRFRKMQQARDDAASAKQNTAAARLAEVTAAVYEPASGYTRASLARLLLAAEKTRNEMPEAAEKIDAWAVPFRDHFTKLLAGQSFVDGAWVSTAELERQAREKRQAAFSSGLDYRIGIEPFPAGAVRGLVTLPLAGAALALAAGAGLLAVARKRTPFIAAGVALLTVTPLALAAVVFLATRNPALLPSAIPMTDEQPVIEALSQAAGLENGATEQKIFADALNSFLARHVRLAPAADASLPADVRQAVAIRLTPGRVAVFEMISSLGLSWMVRIDLEVRQADGKPVVSLTGAKIGALDCPGGFATELWKNLEPQFAEILSASRLVEQFAIQNPGDGAVELKPLAKAAASAP